jgi:hypothetical protein
MRSGKTLKSCPDTCLARGNLYYLSHWILTKRFPVFLDPLCLCASVVSFPIRVYRVDLR